MRTFCPEGQLIKKHTLLNLNTINEAIQHEEIFEGIATVCDNNYNLIVDMGIIKGVIPKEEGAVGVKEGKVKEIALISRVGKPVCFVIKELLYDNSGKPFLMLSRRKAQEKCLKHIQSLPVGSVIKAKITHLESFGAFCDIGCGNVALLPIDAISVSRISHPRDRFSVGDDIKVIIKNIDEKGRISLSHKELLGTWLENANKFKAGQTVSGVVRSVEEYGIFVELAPNLAGLAEPKKYVEVGQRASVYIKSIIPEKMKIKLIIIDSFLGEADKSYEYYYNEDFIDKWQYSPDCSIKTVVSLF